MIEYATLSIARNPVLILPLSNARSSAFRAFDFLLLNRRAFNIVSSAKARAQKARKMGLLELSTSFPDINFALLKSQNYVKIQVQNEYFPRGKNPDSYMLWHEGVGENGDRFAEEWKSSPVVHTRSFSLLYFVCSKSQSLTASIL